MISKSKNFELVVKLKFLIRFSIVILNKYIYGYCYTMNRLILYIKPSLFIYFVAYVKKNLVFKLDSLLDITVVDYPNKPYRFEINYVFLNYRNGYRVIVKLYTDGSLPIYSINNTYPSSNWLEREVWDMFGIKFIFHPNLRRILTDYGFKGHPLRKDFPLTGYIEIYYNDSTQNISATPLEISQNLRFYNFDNSWSKLH